MKMMMEVDEDGGQRNKEEDDDEISTSVATIKGDLDEGGGESQG